MIGGDQAKASILRAMEAVVEMERPPGIPPGEAGDVMMVAMACYAAGVHDAGGEFESIISDYPEWD